MRRETRERRRRNRGTPNTGARAARADETRAASMRTSRVERPWASAVNRPFCKHRPPARRRLLRSRRSAGSGPEIKVARGSGVDTLIRHHDDGAAALAHEALERAGVGGRQAIEAADDDDVEGVEARIAERYGAAGLRGDAARGEAEARDLKSRIALQRAPNEGRRPRRPRLVDLDATGVRDAARRRRRRDGPAAPPVADPVVAAFRRPDRTAGRRRNGVDARAPAFSSAVHRCATRPTSRPAITGSDIARLARACRLELDVEMNRRRGRHLTRRVDADDARA